MKVFMKVFKGPFWYSGSTIEKAREPRKATWWWAVRTKPNMAPRAMMAKSQIA